MACTKNPIIEYVNFIINLHNEDPELSFLDYFQGYPFQNVGTISDGEVCCPDCGKLSFIGPAYSLRDDTDILKNIYNWIGENFPTGCCENYDINQASCTLPNETDKNYFSLICCNSFGDCAPVFNNMMQEYVFANPANANFGKIYSKGVHEYSTFNGDSTLCLLNTVIQTLSFTDKQDFLYAFGQSSGFVSFCDEGGDAIYAGTTEGFLNWW